MPPERIKRAEEKIEEIREKLELQKKLCVRHIGVLLFNDFVSRENCRIQGVEILVWNLSEADIEVQKQNV